MRRKVDTVVDFPFDLDVTDDVVGPQGVEARKAGGRIVYELIAVVNHMGTVRGAQARMLAVARCALAVVLAHVSSAWLVITAGKWWPLHGVCEARWALV